MALRVATLQYVSSVVTPNSSGVIRYPPPLNRLASNQCPTYGMLLQARANNYPIDVDSFFYETPDVYLADDAVLSSPAMVNGQPRVNYTDNMLVCEGSIHRHYGTGSGSVNPGEPGDIAPNYEIYNWIIHIKGKDVGYIINNDFVVLNNIRFYITDDIGCIQSDLPCDLVLSNVIFGIIGSNTRTDVPFDEFGYELIIGEGTLNDNDQLTGEQRFELADDNPYEMLFDGDIAPNDHLYITDDIVVSPSTYNVYRTQGMIRELVAVYNFSIQIE